MSCECLEGNTCTFENDTCRFLLLNPKEIPNEKLCADKFNRGPYCNYQKDNNK